MEFQWDDAKDELNQQKHGISFTEAQRAFLDKYRVIAEDLEHSDEKEQRYFCFGEVNESIVTVRFTTRKNSIRIIGAGYWRKGKKIYEEENKKN
jgi:uncharacterized DUF497 family protein